jgi:hypothetical protein
MPKGISRVKSKSLVAPKEFTADVQIRPRGGRQYVKNMVKEIERHNAEKVGRTF